MSDDFKAGMVKAAEEEVARLNAWADSFTDAHLKERQTGDALVKETLQRAEKAESELAELRRKHERLVKLMKDPTTEMVEAGKATLEFADPHYTFTAMFGKAMTAAMEGGK